MWIRRPGKWGAVAAPLTAVDGNFNSPIETGRGVLDTTGLGTGRHTLFVRGQDALGNWGRSAPPSSMC
ncbi:MAG: hypothetical protein M5U34_39650 [Chloroflexi bacterium]|nr:hypothetical protein [Chloroflexota bacterium]